jgi:high-affinity Fe2+/Pb2+ permease
MLTFSPDIKDLLSGHITAQSLNKLLKDAFAICIKAAKETINGFIEFFRTAVDALLALLDLSIEIPIITPLLRWISGDDAGWALPSPFMIVSFLMAVMQVESHALGITKWSTEKKTFDMAAGLPDAQAMSTWTTTSFAGTPSPPPPANGIIAAAFYDGTTPSCQKQSWEHYSPVSAAAHPLLLGVQMLGSGFTSFFMIAKGFNAVTHGALLTYPLWVLDLIDAAATFVDLTFTFPPFETDVWPAWEFNMIGYSLSIVETVVSCIGVALPTIRKLDDNDGKVEVILTLIRSCLTIARVGIAGHALHEQKTSTAAAWVKSGYHDDAMADLTIGNLVCEGVGALARLAVAGAVYHAETHPDPADLTIAGVIIAVGALFNTGATMADWSVDVVKSDKEYKDGHKGYVGSGRR